MKITGNSGISVNISAVRELGSLLKNINPGDSITASIIRRDGNKAMIEVGGKLISAEFTNGIPREKIVDLILTAKTPEKIQFALKDNDASDKIFRFLSPFSVIHEDDVKKNSLGNLARFINNSKPDIADINLFLLGFKKDEKKVKNSSAFFNHLLQKGVPFQTLIDLSYLIYSRYNPVLFMSYQYMLALNGKKTSFLKKENLSSFEDEMEQLHSILRENESDFYLMLDLITDENKNSEIYGELVFPEDEKFSKIEYITKGNSIFLTFDLSSTGVLQVFVRWEKEQVLINFLSSKEDVILFMKENEAMLKNMLEQKGVKKSVIGYFDSKKIVDKIELWSLHFYTKSEFNVKV